MLRGETITAALRRHATETIGIAPVLAPNAQPDYVYEWFPPPLAPSDGTVFGDDPRKHAVGLSYVLELSGAPQPRNEAIDFAFFDGQNLPGDLWPGCRELFERMPLWS